MDIDYLNKSSGSFIRRNVRFHWRYVANDNDLKRIHDFLTTIHSSPGLINLKLFWESSEKHGWLILTDDKGELVGASTQNVQKGHENLTFGLINFVTEPFRRHYGLGTSLYRSESFGNSTVDAMKYITKAKQNIVAFKVITFYGIPSFRVHRHDVKQLTLKPECCKPKFKIVELTKNAELQQKYLTALLDYDAQMIAPLNRRHFTSRWVSEFAPHHFFTSQKTLIAISDTTPAYEGSSGSGPNHTWKIVGYGTLRMSENCYAVTPLYADSPAIATALLSQLLTEVQNRPVYFQTPAISRIWPQDVTSADPNVTFQLAKAFGLEITEVEIRSYDCLTGESVQYDRARPWHKIYTIHEFWPV